MLSARQILKSRLNQWVEATRSSASARSREYEYHPEHSGRMEERRNVSFEVSKAGFANGSR